MAAQSSAREGPGTSAPVSKDPMTYTADRQVAATAVATLTPFRDPLPIPPSVRVQSFNDERPVTIHMKSAQVRLHADLPLTRMWTYEGSFPGPTLEVRRGQKVRIAWKNELDGPIPLVAVETTNLGTAAAPGREGVAPRADVAALPPWTVVHLHGAVTGGGNDGWTENGVSPGNAQVSEYPNDQPAGTFWYHDHASSITRFNVMTGLAGMYLIRDAEEDALHLPDGNFEVPLVLCDRNVDTDASGNLTGQLLYKNPILQSTPEKVTLPFQGQFTVVNGKIWPYLGVKQRWYRFRLLNASNFRFFSLELHDAHGARIDGALTQIGTDSGLLGAPLPVNQLTLAPAERADVLIDFSRFPGQTLTLRNAAGASDVMQFRVDPLHSPNPFTLPATLSPSFVRLTHATPHDEHRWLVLTPPFPHHPGLWEMEEVDAGSVSVPGDGIVQLIVDGSLVTLRRVASSMHDPVTFMVERDAVEQWTILNIPGPDGAPRVTHPVHIHLIRFQALDPVSVYGHAGWDNAMGGTMQPLTSTGSVALEPSMAGWKDVVRVAPGQLIRLIGRFGGATGQFMYHCHILDHEDEGMMRSFVVMPPEVMPFDTAHGHGGHPV